MAGEHVEDGMKKTAEKKHHGKSRLRSPVAVKEQPEKRNRQQAEPQQRIMGRESMMVTHTVIEEDARHEIEIGSYRTQHAPEHE